MSEQDDTEEAKRLSQRAGRFVLSDPRGVEFILNESEGDDGKPAAPSEGDGSDDDTKPAEPAAG